MAVNKITGFNVYLDGNSLLGKASEVKLPEVGYAMSEHKALGKFAAAEYPVGLEMMTMEIKWDSYYQEIYRKLVHPYQRLQLQIRANVSQFTPAGKTGDIPLVWHVTCTPKKINFGDVKFQEDNAPESEFSVYRFKAVENGQDILEVDTEANILKIGGVDQLAAWRQNLGA